MTFKYHFTVITKDGRYVSLKAPNSITAVKRAERGEGKLIQVLKIKNKLKKSRVKLGYMTYGETNIGSSQFNSLAMMKI